MQIYFVYKNLINLEYDFMSDTILKFVVPNEYNDTIAKWFLRNYCKISSKLLTSLKLTEKGITRDDELLRVVDKIYSGDIIKIKLPQDKNDIPPVKIPLDIRYEDEHIMLVNKQAYMPVHPTRGHYCDTLANGVAYYLQSKGIISSFRAINRLDRDTTGLVLLAKNSYSAANLKDKVKKTYVAICEGEIAESGTVNANISLLEGHTIQRVAGREDGVSAVTHYRPVLYKNNHTLTEFKLETGRTHQIRVHMSYIKHPLSGDDMYGGSLEYIQRQALHCKKIAFIHPITNEKITVETDLPSDMKKILE